MEVNDLLDYPSFSLAAEEASRHLNLPDSNLHDYHECAKCAAPFSIAPEDDKMAVDIPTEEPSDSIQFPLEDARLIFGPQVSFTVVSENDQFSVREVIEALSHAPDDLDGPTTNTVVIPRDKVTDLVEALKACLSRQSQRTVSHAGKVAFWKNKEYFMRPVLKRSLSLP